MSEIEQTEKIFDCKPIIGRVLQIVKCSVPGCTNDSKKDRHLAFHSFPSNPYVKSKWARKIVIPENDVRSKSRVCSKHFIAADYAKGPLPKLKRGSVPSLHLPYRKKKSSVLTPEETVEKIIKIKIDAERSVTPVKILNIPPVKNLNIGPVTTSIFEPEVIISSQDDQTSSHDTPRDIVVKFQKLGNLHTHCISKPISCQTTHSYIHKEKHKISNFIENEKQLMQTTGIQYFLMFDTLVQNFQNLKPKLANPSMNHKDRILLTLIKLKLNLSFKSLSVLFSTSINNCKIIFRNSLSHVDTLLKNVVILPAVGDNLKFTLNILEVSDRKFKFVIGSSLNGIISYIGLPSNEYRINERNLKTRKLITKLGLTFNDKFLTTLESPKNNLSGGRSKVHIERMLHNLRSYNILHGQLSRDLEPEISKIVRIVCALVNMSINDAK